MSDEVCQTCLGLGAIVERYPVKDERKAALATPEEPSLDESWNAVIDVLESLRDHQVSMRSDLNKIMKELGVE